MVASTAKAASPSHDLQIAADWIAGNTVNVGGADAISEIPTTIQALRQAIHATPVISSHRGGFRPSALAGRTHVGSHC